MECPAFQPSSRWRYGRWRAGRRRRGVYRFGEGQYLLIGTKIGGKTDSSGVAQCVNGRVVRAIADDNRLLLIQKMVRQRKADAAASTGDENRARLSDSHGYLL